MDEEQGVKPLEVVAAVIRGVDGRVLVAQRPINKHQGGKWEFPGGKVEQGESRRSALGRELNEELGIEISGSTRLISVYHEYEDKSIYLDVYEVTSWEGEPSGREGQPIKWLELDELKNYEFPAANAPIIEAACLPKLLKILKPVATDGAFRDQISTSLASGQKLFLHNYDEQPISHEQLNWFLDTAAEQSAEVIFQSPPALVRSDFGIHLNSEALLKIQEKPVAKRVSASCYSPGELFKAQRLGVDFILIEPVLMNLFSSGREALGWPMFQSLASRVNIPVYAAGGLSDKDLDLAREYGAQGIASTSFA